ncbi:MAG: glycogen debranching enzyme family protein [Clostridia bacterium]|nr:glycogen debranching enzyme family protein [Clostridia bacterium]
MYKFTKEELLQNEFSKTHEWLLTNGIGGFAMSTLCGLNTRKYHGLLVAACGKTRERRLILSKLNEALEIDGKSYSLATNECPGYLEDGYVRQDGFSKIFLPSFTYSVKDVLVKKKVALVHGENTVCVSYEIKTDRDGAKFVITPLFNHRDFHATNSNVSFSQAYSEEAVRLDLGEGLKAYMDCDGDYIEYENTIYEKMYYRMEDERGLECLENHYIPGSYEIEIEPNTSKEICFIVSLDKMEKKENVLGLMRREEIRLEKVCKIASARNEIEMQLAVAADNFIVQGNEGKTIIAGYPWFGSWGRDTFIALEGLTLKTNRFSDAKSILLQFSKYIQNGLVPNLITENGGAAYNSVDGSLWYIEAFYEYIMYTKDFNFLREIYPKLLEIINAYQQGTENHIYMDTDYLIVAGNENTQLTWMDAKVGDVIPTPRYGKAVEINALWYNALRIMNYFSDILETDFDREICKKVKASFTKFFCEKGLFDTIEPENSQIRPNQIMAMGLSFPVISGDKAVEVLELVTKELLTDKGLKTLDSHDSEYRGTYAGGVYERDMSYHQGTVWPWLWKVYGNAYREIKRERFAVANVEELLMDGCIGNVAEIYDGDEPRYAKGAPAQAWSTAAILENI